MSKWFASRSFTIGGMLLVPALLVSVDWSGTAILVASLPWLGLCACLHVLAREGRISGADTGAHPPDSRRVEAVLSDRVIFERTTSAILEDFIHCEPEDFDASMSQALSRLGSYTGAARCYLYRFRNEGEESVLLLNWRAPLDEEVGDTPDLLPAENAVWLKEILEKDPVVLVNDVAGSDHPLVEDCPWLRAEDPVRSCGAVRIVQDGRIVGFLGMDARVVSEWGSGERSLLKLVANLFSAMFARVDAHRFQLEAIEHLKASSRAKTDFLANMSHEIRTPLNGVIGIADLLQEMGLTPPQLEYVDMIRESGSLLMNLVNDVLDLSKIEAGELLLEDVPTDLRALLEDLVGLIAFSAQARDLEVVCRLAPDVPERVLVDPGRLRQILTNLLGNAAKFTQEGHVYLNVEAVGSKGNLVEVQFEVADTGIGISRAQADRIFEKFTQADASTTRRFGGTGLGLSISRHLVSLMGGRIWADGVPGEGSTFSFALPLKPLAQPEPAPAPEPGQNVLLVTGHELGGLVMSEQIRQMGHRCEVATWTGATGGLLPRTVPGGDDPWSVVILDPTTLVEAVDSVLALVDTSPADQRPRLILLSRLTGTPGDRKLGYHRADGILAKPVRRERLALLLAGNLVPGLTEMAIDAHLSEDTVDASEDPTVAAPRILLAEDNPFNQRVACGMLELLGCQVTLAATGGEALDHVRNGGFDLVFMDCQMPIMDGFEATRQIRDLSGPVSRVPIIAITANAFRGDREACLAAGMDDFLTKPVTKVQIERMLAKWEPGTESLGTLTDVTEAAELPVE